jgi:putative lipoprotein (rSAM/lipoprotein system)
MKVRFYHWYNALLSSLLTLLGFGSCSTVGADEYGSPVSEYGTPYADYHIKGDVTDEQGNPLEGIKAVLKEMPDEAPQYAYSMDSTVTDKQGKFEMGTRVYISSRRVKLVVEDTDGQAGGGEFASDTLVLEDLPKKQTAEGQHWSTGTYELKADVKLKKK